jgi:hypothetical protein
MPTYKKERLPPRNKLFGWDYNKSVQFRMSGREWHVYAKRDTFKVERGGDAAYSGNGIEVWLDGTDINHKS